ncbi:MAG: hypothetical protein HZA54_13370 [Planctomycetes bacterium]|nr:hypothetical protein [Planctomycetota bacterium]
MTRLACRRARAAAAALLAAGAGLLALALTSALAPRSARAEENPYAPWLPRLAKQDWWVLRVDREVAPAPGAAPLRVSCHLLYYVVEIAGGAATVLVTSTDNWSFLVQLDLATFTPRKVVPSCFSLDYPKERLSITSEKSVYDVEARPGLVCFPEYRTLDFLFFGFPAADPSKGKLSAVTEAEAKGETVSIRSAPLVQTAEAKDGVLWAAFSGTLDGRAFRLATVWRAGAPAFERAEFVNEAIGSRGTARLLAYGPDGKELFLAPAHGYYMTNLNVRDKDAPIFRQPIADLLTRPAVEAAARELATAAGPDAGADLRPLDLKGEGYFHRGDALRVYWHLRHIPKVTSGTPGGPPPEPPKNKMTIPTFGYFSLRVLDLRRIGAEDLIFLGTPGADDRDYSYRSRVYSDSRSSAESVWSLMAGQGGYGFTQAPYWRASADKKSWEWWRVRTLRAAVPYRPVVAAPAPGTPVAEEAKHTRPPTWWVIVLRRSDLALRALFGYTLDDELRPRPFDVKLTAAPDAPVYTAQGLQLLRPIDWLVMGGWVALGRPAAPGTLLQVSQTTPGQFRAQFEPATKVEQFLIKNDDFFDDLRALLAKKDKDAEKRKKRGEKKQAQTLLAAGELERLEKGPGGDAPLDRLRLLEEGSARLKTTVLRVGFGREVFSYLGYDWSYPFWKEAAVVNFADSYMATLNLLVPSGHARGT